MLNIILKEVNSTFVTASLLAYKQLLHV